MTTHAERWRQVRQFLDQALKLPAVERADFLQEACDDESIRQEVSDLIERRTVLGTFLEQPFFSLQADVDLGSRVGAYRLVRTLGRGGMGVVYLAERSDGEIHQEVAIKLLRRGLDTEEILNRFRMERQTLASLVNPFIARLLDGGTTESGRPFIVMEYVEGETIDDYCEANRLDTRRRVELFRQVCSAVHFAHQNLVVHRDLKPANILIAADGTPRLLDFGIAKFLERDPNLPAVTAKPGEAPLSLSYASPEQLDGRTITTASDVYSLGVVLYEVLTGTWPHRLDGLSREDAAKHLRDATPTRPSSVVQRRVKSRLVDECNSEFTLESTNRHDRHSRRLARRLRGDLDNIVLKALHPDPEYRFASVEQMSEELRRHLEGMPVRSRPQTFLYRSEKFIRRNAIGLTLAALVAALTVSGLGMFFERQKTARERDRAEVITAFLTNFIQAPNRTRGETLTVLEAMNEGIERIGSELVDQPGTLAALLDAAAGVYRNLALYEEARPLLERALELRREIYGENHVLVAETLHNFANLERDEGRRDKAEKLMRQAVGIQRRGFASEHRDLAAGINNLALLLREMGKLEEAESLAREALEMKEIIFGLEHLELSKPLNTLARLLRERGSLKEAEKLYRRSLRLCRLSVDQVNPRLANVLNALGGVMIASGNPEAAGPLYEESLKVRRKLYVGDHPELATTLSNIGRQRILVGQLSSALTFLEEGEAIARRLVAADRIEPVREALLKRNLAWARLATGDFKACEELAEAAHEVLEMWRKKPRFAAEAKSLRGACLVGLGRMDEGKPFLLEGYEDLLESEGEDSLMTRLALERLFLVESAE